MQLGDFFKAAPAARPVVPRLVEFTATTRNDVLPGGTPNPRKQIVAAKVKAGMVFLGGEGFLDARLATRKSLSDKYKDQPTDAFDFNVELTYQMLARILCEWDEKEKTVGAKLFPDAASVREFVEFTEADRVMNLYNEYVKEEHPASGPDSKSV